MSIEETIEARKFRELGVSKVDFDRLPIVDRITRLKDFKEGLLDEHTNLLTTSGDARRRIAELNDSIAGTYRVVLEYEATARRIEGLRTQYREAVHAERVQFGRLGAYTRWYRYFRARRQLERASRYADLISEIRRNLPTFIAEVARIRAELRTMPRLDRLLREIDDMRAAISVYESRLSELEATKTYAVRRLDWISELITETDREIKELEIGVKIVRHKYRELSMAITAAIQYESERRGGEAGHDIDVEVHLDFTVKSLLPTRYSENEAGWIEEIQELIRSEACGLLKSCSDEYFLMPWDKILPEGGWTCNIVGRRIVRRTIVTATKYYEEVKPPINKKALIGIFRRELGRYCYISQISISVLRATELRGDKSRSSYGESTIGDCMNRRRGEIVSAVVDWDVSEEIDELMRYLSE